MTLAEDHGLAGAPVLVEDLNAVGCGDEGQVRLLTSSWMTSMCGHIVDFGDARVVGSGAALSSTPSRVAGRSRSPPRIRQKSSLAATAEPYGRSWVQVPSNTSAPAAATA